MFNWRKLVRFIARVSLMALSLAALFISAERGSAEEKEPVAILEFGGSGEWGLPNGGGSFGPSVAFEFSVIKDWLVIEAGTAPLFSQGQTEWDTDLVFKKPFDLFPTVEFEPGIGPAWQHTVGGGRTVDAIAGEVVFEFMVWPTRDRKWGWFVEPSYSISFATGHDQSLGVSVGLLVAIP